MAVYGGLCALASFDRQELQKKVLSSRYVYCYLRLYLHGPPGGGRGGGEDGKSHVKKQAGDVNRDIRQTNQVFHKLIILNAIIMNLRDDLDT